MGGGPPRDSTAPSIQWTAASWMPCLARMARISALASRQEVSLVVLGWTEIQSTMELSKTALPSSSGLEKRIGSIVETRTQRLGSLGSAMIVGETVSFQ